MTGRRIIAVVLTIALLFTYAAAEETLLTLIPGEDPVYMSVEEIHAFVDLLFTAATGTTTKEEKALRTGMNKEAIVERNAVNAEYRARMLPWLIAVLQPEVPLEEIVPDEAESPTPEPTPEATLSPEEEVEYTTVDSYEAFPEMEAGRAYLATLEEMGGDSLEKCLQITQAICQVWMAEVDHAELMEMNGDYSCWIYAPDTPIDYPIVQCGNNERYLDIMFNGQKNAAGTLFIDYRNLPDFQDPNTLVYGHHMRNKGMFGKLAEYREQTYFEGHPFMLVMTPNEVFILEVFAGYTTTYLDHCYDIAISDEEDMLAFVEEAERKSNFVSGVSVGTTDRLVTLSTCAYSFENARYIVIGRIVPVWKQTDTEIEHAENALSQPVEGQGSETAN